MTSQLPAGYEPGLDHPPQPSSPQHLVASFLSQDEQEPPPDVAPLTAAFLRDAILTGARQRLDDRSARLIAGSCAAEATLARCGKASGTSTERVRQLIGSGLCTLWERLPAELQAQYPWEVVPKSMTREQDTMKRPRRSGATQPIARMTQEGRVCPCWRLDQREPSEVVHSRGSVVECFGGLRRRGSRCLVVLTFGRACAGPPQLPRPRAAPPPRHSNARPDQTWS